MYEVRVQSWVRHVRNKTKEIDDSVLVTFDVDTNSANMTDPTLYTYLVRALPLVSDGRIFSTPRLVRTRASADVFLAISVARSCQYARTEIS